MKTVLLKLSGELLSSECSRINKDLVVNIAEQIKKLQKEIHFGIVIGGGNFFRGARQSGDYHVSRASADTVGMLATVMNGVLLQDIFSSVGLETHLVSALPVPTIAPTITAFEINERACLQKTIIFVGGTGNPFFTTDTNAVLRALQIKASGVWKATGVDGVYSADPKKDSSSTLLKKITYQQVLEQKLGVIDMTAVALAGQHGLPIRIFNLFEKDALLKAASDADFGSIIAN